MKINIKLFYSRNQDSVITPQKVLSCNFHHVVLLKAVKGENSEKAQCKQAWKYRGSVLTLPLPTTPLTMPYGLQQLFREISSHIEHTPLALPWTQKHSQTAERISSPRSNCVS